MILGAGVLESTSRICSLVTFSGSRASTRSSISGSRVCLLLCPIVSAAVAPEWPPPGCGAVMQPVIRNDTQKTSNALVIMGHRMVGAEDSLQFQYPMLFDAEPDIRRPKNVRAVAVKLNIQTRLVQKQVGRPIVVNPVHDRLAVQ